jgi:hypothetical protein
MTWLGKSLVFAAFVFGMMAAVWSYGIYTSRIDWPGELARLGARAKELDAGLRAAEAGWQQGRTELAALEARRPADRRWYEAQLAALRTAPKGQAVQVTVVNPGNPPERRGLLDLDPQTGLPKLEKAADRANRPLLSLTGYDEEEKDVLASVDQENKRLADLVRKDEELTNLLIGEPPDGKGLHERIREERAKIAGVLEEQKLTEPLLVNATAERDIVGRRERVLQARIEELKKVGVAQGARAR